MSNQSHHHHFCFSSGDRLMSWYCLFFSIFLLPDKNVSSCLPNKFEDNSMNFFSALFLCLEWRSRILLMTTTSREEIEGQDMLQEPHDNHFVFLVFTTGHQEEYYNERIETLLASSLHEVQAQYLFMKLQYHSYQLLTYFPFLMGMNPWLSGDQGGNRRDNKNNRIKHPRCIQDKKRGQRRSRRRMRHV